MSTEPTPTPAVAAATPADAARTGRRKAILGLAGLAAGGAAVAVAGADPAGAAGHGQAMTLGDPTNTASATTGVTMDSATAPAFKATNSSLGPGVMGIRDQPSGISVNSAGVVGDAINGIGVEGLSHGQPGVVGKSIQSNGMWGESQSGVGVRGDSATQYGVYGTAGSVGSGVAGYANHEYDQGAGVVGYNGKGIALLGHGKIQARLLPAEVPGTPTRYRASPGSLHVDSLGVLRYAVAENTWKTMVTPTSAGAFHVLPSPARVYDSRPGTQPTAVGPKTKLVANQARVIDLKANASGVPVGATAALLTVLLVNAPKANGNVTVWAAGVAKPLANTLVWGGDAGRFTAQATTAVDPQTLVQIQASHATDVVIDVVGYYA